MQREKQQLHFFDYSGMHFVSTNLMLLLIKLLVAAMFFPASACNIVGIFNNIPTSIKLIVFFPIFEIHSECNCIREPPYHQQNASLITQCSYQLVQ